MNAEEALKETMLAQVADVQATPALGGAVRRRHRRRVTRLRTAGAALAMVAVAGTVPAYLTMTSAGELASSPRESEAVATIRSGIVVPDVVGKDAKVAGQALKAAGLNVQSSVGSPSSDMPAGIVVSQSPPAGDDAEPGAEVTVIVSSSSEAGLTVTKPQKLPPQLGDLGDEGGHRFAGVDFVYLPEGLKWVPSFESDAFGNTSNSTSWSESGKTTDGYGIQVIVYGGKAVERVSERMAGYGEQGAEPIEIRGKEAYLVSVGEPPGELANDKNTPSGEPRARVLTWVENPGLAIELLMSPGYAKKIDADAELKKIADALRPAE
ncbi:PASTA domain-containing protein [Streptosporangium subroseum]|uniref:PASTA domain-containing protein n=1 Tax=Streptosporangium subroseum TaxID=106412 RepID=UPI00308BF3C9|nr:PASTA domain-containing protein [Streptosporangium subroseum]